MFEPYYTTKSSGRGLGLAALLGIVRRHHGTVLVDSVPGHGTKVIVWFPSPPAGLSAAVSDPGSFSRSVRRTGRVLLAEDEELVRQVAARMLANLGYEVVAVADGIAAFAALDQHDDFALALIDVQMPRIDGRQVLRHLRAVRPEVPAVLMTGYAGQDPGTDNPPDAWLRKPFSLKELTAALDAARPGATAA